MLIDPLSNPTYKFPQETSDKGVNLADLIMIVDDQILIRVVVEQFMTNAGAN